MKKWHEGLNDNNFKFIIQLGDMIDEKASEKREKTLNLILNELEFLCKFVVNFKNKKFEYFIIKFMRKNKF